MKSDLLNILSDGNYHSGESLGALLGIGRSAVWKRIHALEDRGIEVFAVSGKGYRLASPVELLCKDKILMSMRHEAREIISGIEIHQQTTSTNQLLLNNIGVGASSGYVCLAESQSAGRGRRGRDWYSPYARNLYCSINWKFTDIPETFSGLGLAIGVGMASAMRRLGLPDTRLKWPNDVIWRDAKLAGILIEMSGESCGPCNVVVGIGLNINMPKSAGASISQPWVDLKTALGKEVSRNEICAIVLEHLVDVLQHFEESGLAPFIEEWRRLDVLNNKPVTIEISGRKLHGTAQGIDDNGAVMIAHDHEVKHYMTGDITLREDHGSGCRHR